MTTDDPRHDNFVLLSKDLSAYEMAKAYNDSPFAKEKNKKPIISLGGSTDGLHTSSDT